MNKRIARYFNTIKNRKFDFFLMALAFAATVLVIFSGAFMAVSETLNVGDISPKRYIATRNVENTVETQRLRQKAEESVGELYKHDPDVAVNAKEQIDSFFESVDSAIAEMKIEAGQEAARKNALSRIGGNEVNAVPEYNYAINPAVSIPIYFSPVQYEEYDKLSTEDKEKFKEDIKYAADYAFEQGITDDTRDRVVEQARSIIDAYQWNDILKSMAYSTVDSVVVPNLVLDEEAIEAAKEQRASEVEPVMILKNQKIIDSGEVITEEAFVVLMELGLINNGYRDSFIHITGSCMLAFLCFTAACLYLGTIQKRAMEKSGTSLLLFFIYLLALAIMFATERLNDYAFVPLSVFAMLVSILIKPKIALVLNIFVCVIGCFIFNGDLFFLVYFLITGSFSAILVQYTQKRTMVLIVAVAVGFINMAAYFAISIFTSGYSNTIFMGSLYACVIGVVSLVMVIGSLPLWEGVFGINTKFTLAELANPNNEIMRRLIIETPGTYHHSLVVANLAETAAYEIYANETLAKVGALFHDIGKLKNPQCFSENQFGENIHDNLDPSVSAQMIMRHVSDGLEMADDAGLPKVVRDIIEQHHGTTLVKYFFVKCAKEKDKTGDVVHESDFRYPGPIPQSKEAAVVMLADTVEAAVRSYVSSGNDSAGIEGLVDKLFKDKLDDGQLDDCRLDLKEIEVIKKSFMKMLSGMYHHRVSYPKQEEVDETRKKEAIRCREEK